MSTVTRERVLPDRREAGGGILRSMADGQFLTIWSDHLRAKDSSFEGYGNAPPVFEPLVVGLGLSALDI